MLEIILVQGFCPLKIIITAIFPNGFPLNLNLLIFYRSRVRRRQCC